MRQRASNIELLRVVAIVLVVVSHSNFWILGSPSPADVAGTPLPTFVRILLSQLSVVCVNVFILISGWFGIKPKIKSLLNLLFLLFFWQGVYLLCQYFATGFLPHGVVDWIAAVNPLRGWFIQCYLGLYLLSPALNAFVEKEPKIVLARYLTIFVVGQIVFEMVFPYWTIFKFGYSVPSLVALYLIGRYMNMHRPSWITWSSLKAFSGYFIIFVISTVSVFLMMYLSGSGQLPFLRSCSGMLKFACAYTAPHVMIGSVLFFIAFLNLKIEPNRFVNHIAGSALAIFFFHICDYYFDIVRAVYAKFSGATCLALIAVCVIAVSFGAVLIDQIRILAWVLIQKGWARIR